MSLIHICMYSRCNDIVEELSLHFLLYRTICIALQFAPLVLSVNTKTMSQNTYIHTLQLHFYFAKKPLQKCILQQIVLCPKKYCDNPIVHHKTYGNSDLVYYILHCHSSEIRGLRSTKCSSEMLQNLLYFMHRKTHVVFFVFHFVQLYIFTLSTQTRAFIR